MLKTDIMLKWLQNIFMDVELNDYTTWNSVLDMGIKTSAGVQRY